MTPEHKALVQALGRLRLDAGNPTLRAISGNTGGTLSHASIAEMLNGRRQPRWKSVAIVVAALGGDRPVFYRLWEAAWLARPDPRDKEEELGLHLAANLDILLRAVAETSAPNLGLLAHCKRCRNRLLYLLQPGSPDMTGMVVRRLRALHIDHEDHGNARSFDDATPKIL